MDDLNMEDDEHPVGQPRPGQHHQSLPGQSVPPQPIENTQLPLQPITDEEVACKYVEPSIYNLGGPMMHFINTSCDDSVQCIGMTRLPAMDIRLVPAYLHRYETILKIRARKALEAHFKAQQCTLGIGESLTLEDFSFSFSITSLSDVGDRVWPLARKEGPLSWCLIDKFIQTVPFNLYPDGSMDVGHTLNAYIHLNAPKNRRRAVLQEMNREKQKAESAPTVVTPNAEKGKSIPGRTVPQKRTASGKVLGSKAAKAPAQRVNVDEIIRKAANLAEQRCDKKITKIAKTIEEKEKNPPFPDLKPSKGLRWANDGVPDLPNP